MRNRSPDKTPGSSSNQTLLPFVCSLGGTVFGYDLGALSSASQSVHVQFGLSPSSFGITIAASLWGTVCGSLFAGLIADRFGRRSLIVSSALLYLVSSLGIASCTLSDWTLFLVLRILCGVAIGAFTVGCPLYLAELSSPEQRGKFVAWFQVQVGAGVILGFMVGTLLARFLPPLLYWRGCFGCGAIPPLVLLLLFMRTSHDTGLSRHGNENIALSFEPAALKTRYSKKDRALFRRKNLRPMLLATSIALFNQLSGVNVILIYLLDVLSGSSIETSQRHTYTVAIACISFATTIIGAELIDRVGRKILLTAGAAGMALCLFILGTRFQQLTPLLSLMVLVGYNFCFAFSQGAVVWVYLSELFPNQVRAKGQSYGTCLHWIANAALVSLFPTFQKIAPEMAFRVFSLVMVFQIGVVALLYPETKGIPLEENV